MSVVLPAVLAGAAVAVAGGLPGRAVLRLDLLHARRRPAAPPARAGSVLAVVLTGVLLGPGAALLLAAVAVAAPRVLAARAAAASRQSERRRAVEACAALAGELRAGRAPSRALEVAAGVAEGPSAEALRAASAAALWGGSVPAALRTTSARSAVPELLRGLAACWQVCAQAGSGLAAAVERLADGLRARQAQERAVAAALAGPRASAALLALLPLAGVALAAGLGARPLHVLLHTPLGIGCLVLGLALDALGLLWTRQLVTRAAGQGR
jgi:tight adherence protein B